MSKPRSKHAFFIQGPLVVVPDGIVLEGGDGRRYEVIQPKWWQLFRWLGWWLSSGRVKGEVRLISVQGGSIVVRVRELPDE